MCVIIEHHIIIINTSPNYEVQVTTQLRNIFSSMRPAEL